MKDLVFLGGTCGNNNWRDEFIAKLMEMGVPRESLFDPVVADWNEAAQAAEEQAKRDASFLLYYIADPKLPGNPISSYSLVEATMGLYDNPAATVVVFDTEGMAGHLIKSMNQSAKVLKNRFPNCAIFATKEQAIEWTAAKVNSLVIAGQPK